MASLIGTTSICIRSRSYNMYDIMFRQRADMGLLEGRYGCTRGPIWVLNHEPYRPG